jgi:hypothetical protein
VVSNASNINSVAGNSTNINSVAGSITNVNTVASNLASVNNFGEVYRISASAPTSSLDLGDLYFDTTSDTLKVYGASGWQNAGSSINGTSQRYHYDISGTPTSVTGADANGNTLTYDAGYVDVYVNGVRMSTADVTVTSGDTVTFAEALADGDEVDIVGFGTFSVASLNADNLDSGTVPDARITGAYTGITNLTMSGNLTVDTNTLYVDSANNRVGVGTTSPETILHVRDTSAIMRLVSDTNSTSGVDFGDTADTNIGRLLYDHTDNSMRFTTNTSERMRIDSSGNVGIGKSSFGSISTDGFWWESASNYLALSANGTSPIYMNRNGSDGGLINFYKSGTNVGNIGTFGSALYISSPDGTDAGLRVGNSTVVPVTTTGGLRDNAIDLGSASARWKDLYLSGGVYLGGTGSANKLDDFEEGNWSPSVQDYGGTATIGNANYTKIGRVVHASASIVLDGTSDASQFRINGLPFTSLNTANNVFGGFVSYSNSTFTDNIYLLVGSNDTSIFLYEPGGTGFTYNDLGANKQIRFVVTYFTA